MSDDAELLAEFLAEGRENLARLEHELLSFEGQCTPEMLAATFRTAHTIKGNAGFFGFTKLQAVMHSAESLLSRIRDGELVLTSPIVSLLRDHIPNFMIIFMTKATMVCEATSGVPAPVWIYVSVMAGITRLRRDTFPLCVKSDDHTSLT